jgi:predicted metal-dependent hydrolase
MRAVTVTVPLQMPLERAKAFVQTKQAWIEKHLRRMRQIESPPPQPEWSQEELDRAQDALFGRLEHFSKRHQLAYNRAAFRCQKTLWGSCSGRNHISLNINIVFLPEHLQDYILLHELCHIRHKNHSRDFWTLLDQYCGGKSKLLAKELKSHQMPLRPS